MQYGGDVAKDIMGVGDSRTQAGKATTAHEMGHVMLGKGQHSHNASVAMGTVISDFSGKNWANTPIDYGTVGQTEAEGTRRALGKLGTNEYPDCEGRVGKAPDGAQEAPARLKSLAEEMMKRFPG